MPTRPGSGNEADVTLGDSIGWLVESPEIDVVMAYAESIRNVDSFLAALEAAHRAGKPVILHKVGRSALGSRAALSHTASLAGDSTSQPMLSPRVTSASLPVATQIGVPRRRWRAMPSRCAP